MSNLNKLKLLSMTKRLVKPCVAEVSSTNAAICSRVPKSRPSLNQLNLQSLIKSDTETQKRGNCSSFCTSLVRNGSRFLDPSGSGYAFSSRHFVTSTVLSKDAKQADGPRERIEEKDEKTVVANKETVVSPSGDEHGQANSSQEGLQAGAKRCIVFTCKVCKTRAAKLFSKHAYEKGIVIIRCPGCDSLHLIADNLGWFSHFEHRNVEQMLAARGEDIKHFVDGDGTLELTAEDITGPLDTQSDGSSGPIDKLSDGSSGPVDKLSDGSSGPINK